MPVYQYACRDCRYQFEARQSFHDDPLSICPKCEASSIRRVINPVGIIFKGSGFYITDNKKKNGRNGSNGTNGSNGINGSDKNSKVNGANTDAKTNDTQTSNVTKKEAKTEKTAAPA